MQLRNLIYGLIGYFCLIPAVKTHQPVMDMAPRWAKGYGIQSWYEHSNDETQTRKVEENTVRLEGVYTFTREHRITLKIPISSKSVTQNGQHSSFSYLGDAVIGFQNKLYFNEKKFTANLGLNPSIRIPTRLGDDSSSPERNFGYSLSLSASVESFLWYGLIDFFYWGNTRSSDGTRPEDLFGFDLDIAYHPYHNNSLNIGLFLMMGFDGRFYQNNSTADQNLKKRSIMQVVPTLVLYKDNVMLRSEYYIPVWQEKNQGLKADSFLFRLGVGVTFE